MEETLKIEELAEMLGVTKQTIYNKLKEKEYKKYIIKKGNKTVVNIELYDILKPFYETKKNVNNDIIELLKQQLEVKDKQLEIKDKQIAELQKGSEQLRMLLASEQNKTQLLLEEHKPRQLFKFLNKYPKQKRTE